MINTITSRIPSPRYQLLDGSQERSDLVLPSSHPQSMDGLFQIAPAVTTKTSQRADHDGIYKYTDGLNESLLARMIGIRNRGGLCCSTHTSLIG